MATASPDEREGGIHDRSNGGCVPTKPCRGLGLLAAAFVCWALIDAGLLLAALDTSPMLPTTLASAPAETFRSTLGAGFAWIVITAFFGLPIAVVVCFVIGYPAWIIAGERGLTRRHDAATVGANIGFVLYVAWAMYIHMPAAVRQLLERGVTPEMVQGLFGQLCASLYVAGVGAVAGLTAWHASGMKTSDRKESP